jgi:D-alanine-D-alanine ligase
MRFRVVAMIERMAWPEVSAAAMGRVAVLAGGRSAEREVSLMSGHGVLAALREAGVAAELFDPASRPLSDLASRGFARVFIALHGRYGEDGTVQGALELAGIPYTGSGVIASAVGIDKVITKKIWIADGLPTPAFGLAVSLEQAHEAVQRIGLPVAVKPSREGSTIGFSRVDDIGQLAAAFELACRHDPQVLIEAFVDGRELTVAILECAGELKALPVIEIRAPGGNYDYANKYLRDETAYDCPAELDAPLTQAVQDLALAAARSVGCQGWGRVDIMLRRSDAKPYLLEINTSPGMTGHSLVPMAAKAEGISYEDLCVRILETARLKAGGAAK